MLSGHRLAGHVTSTCLGLVKSPRMCWPRAKLLAGLNQAERSEARRAKRGIVRCAKRSPPPPKAAAPAEGGSAEGAAALRAVFKRKLEAESQRQPQSQTRTHLFRVRRHRPPMFISIDLDKPLLV